MPKFSSNLLRGAAAFALCAAAGAASATPINFDVVFLLDGSGSVGTTQFHSELQLINTIHDQFVALAPSNPNVNYRFGVIEFSTTSVTKLQLNAAYSATTVNAISYAAGSTYLKTAVQSGLDLFNAEGGVNEVRQMFMFTDGVPNPSSQNPTSLAPKLDQANVNMTLLGLQGFTDASIKALVDDRTRDEIMAASYTAANTKEINDRLLQPATNVPEPGSVALLLAGLGGALPLLRRRRRK